MGIIPFAFCVVQNLEVFGFHAWAQFKRHIAWHHFDAFSSNMGWCLTGALIDTFQITVKHSWLTVEAELHRATLWSNFLSCRCKPAQPKPHQVSTYVCSERFAIGGSGQLLSKPCWEKLSRWGPWRVLLLHTCALLYSFNYSLWTQTDLFILRRSICWGLVGTENTHATHTRLLLFSCKSIYTGQHKLYQPAEWVTSISCH